VLRFYTAGEFARTGARRLPLRLAGGPPRSTSISSITNCTAAKLGYGRGGRQKIERDRAEIFAGVRTAKPSALPSPPCASRSRWANWEKALPSKTPRSSPATTKSSWLRGLAMPISPLQKFDFHDARYILERASAARPAARVAGASLASCCSPVRHEIVSHTISIATSSSTARPPGTKLCRERRSRSPLRCVDSAFKTR